jgi:hypothetical protein
MRRSMTRPLAALVTALCLVGVVAAAATAAPRDNGVSAKSPDAIVSAAVAAGQTARSVHVHGGGVDAGTPVSVDVWVGKKRGRGRIHANGSSVDVIRIGNVAYFRAAAAFWRKAGGTQGAALAPLFAGKWMEGSATKGDLADLSSLLDIRSLLRSFLGDHGTLANAGTTTFHGQPAVAIDDTTEGGTLYVATTGKPYPLGVRKAGKSGGTILFDHWNAPLTVKAPKHPIDLRSFLKP